MALVLWDGLAGARWAAIPIKDNSGLHLALSPDNGFLAAVPIAKESPSAADGRRFSHLGAGQWSGGRRFFHAA